MEKEVDKRPPVIKELDMSISNIMFSLQRLEANEAIEYLKGVAEFCIVRSNVYKRSEDVSFRTLVESEMKIFFNKISGDARKECAEERPDAAYVYICDKPVWLDLHNLRDKDRAWMREPDDHPDAHPDVHPDVHPDEHYFPQDLAIEAAELQGKRPLTRKEHRYIASLPWGWDDEKKGIWITFNKVEGGIIEIFFPASGYRDRDNGAFTSVGAAGLSWSASANGANSFYLGFNSTSVHPQNSNSRAYGFPVRCLSEL